MNSMNTAEMSYFLNVNPKIITVIFPHRVVSDLYIPERADHMYVRLPDEMTYMSLRYLIRSNSRIDFSHSMHTGRTSCMLMNR